MLKVNKKLEYALVVLKHLQNNKPTHLVTAREISETYHLPFDTTSRVMQLMANAGFINASQGATGGYSIRTPLEKLNFLELATVILGPITVADCLSNPLKCQLVPNCKILSPIIKLNNHILELCKSINLAELLQTSYSDEKSFLKEAYSMQDKQD